MKEKEIRPEALFDEFLRLAQEDIETFFRGASYQSVPCPACGNADSEFAFDKNGFEYETCSQCDTLFVNPRPAREAFYRYYQEAPSIKFWANRFYKETENARRESIFKPRAKMVLDKVGEFADLNAVRWLADIGAGYGVFCEEASKIFPDHVDVIAIEPSPDLASVCSQKGLTVVNRFLEDITGADLGSDSAGVLTSFELMEHLHAPDEFLRSCASLMRKDGLLIFTTLSGTGLDIQVLWERSKSVSPPHHLNFLNPKSIELLLDRCGFETVEVTTPGKLDVNILENNMEHIKDRFMRTFLQTASQEAKEDLQGFLQRHNLSSHMMVFARRKGE
jgi:2-polyprenyl-3-methyl-5-hydroxy-6-metoxy-1,4-benzoquinol methylase